MVKKSLFWVYRFTLLTLWLAIFVFAAAVLSMRYLVLPNIDKYRADIEARATAAMGQKVSIGEIKASWDGLNPHLSLYNVDIHDAEERPALSLGHVEASLSWLSIPLLEPRLSSIEIYQPELTIRRDAQGTLYVAGMAMGGPSRPQFANWALRQSRIDVLDASVIWEDELRKAPPLSLTQLNLRVVSPAWKGLIGHHMFGLRALPSAGSSAPIDIRGNLYGKDISQPEDWSGTVYAKLEGTDISAWRKWISYPFDLYEGYGAARFWLQLDDGKPSNIVSDVILSDVKTRLSASSPQATLNHLSGRLSWDKHKDGQEFTAENIKLNTPDGLDMQNGSISLRERWIKDKQWIEGRVRLDEILLDTLNTFAGYIPLPKNVKQNLQEISPTGKLENVDISWRGSETIPQEYSLRSKFSNLGMRPFKQFPGFSNLSGSVDADEDNGTLTLNARNASLELENIMRWPIPADRLSGEVKWTHNKTGLDIRVKNFAIANPHLAGTINANYLMNGVKGGYLDLSAKFGQADAQYARFYYPKILGEHTLAWLDSAILKGRGQDINVTVKGNLHDFPYPNNKTGLFRVTAKINDGELDYAPGWPKILGIKLDMLFEGNRMELNATDGTILGTRITKANIAIPGLHVAEPVLNITGEANGLVSDGIRFINNSPLLHLAEGFTPTLVTSGDGKLNLQLNIPLHDPNNTKVKGTYTIKNGSMSDKEIPEITRINGKLEFTENGLHAQNVSHWIYGGPAVLNLVTNKDHSVHITARGRLNDAGLRQAFGPGMADRISGSTDWNGDIHIQNKMLNLTIDSSLVGITSSLPPPLNKSPADIMPLHVEKRQTTPSQDSFNVALGNFITAKILRSELNGKMKIDHGDIAVNAPAESPSQSAQPGINVRAVLEQLDADEWRNLADKATASMATSNTPSMNGAAAPAASVTSGNSSTALPPIAKVDLTVNRLDIFDKRINSLKLNARPITGGWQLNVQSHEMNGDIQWLSAGNGKVIARLKNLISPSSTPNTAELRTQGDFKQQAQQYPALDIVAENYEMGNKKLGRLELQASEQNDDWSIEKLKIINPDSTLTAEGEWHNWKRNPNTRITLNWDIKDLGKTLERFGYPGTVKGGEADLTGQLKWPGSPHEFNSAGLSGNLQLDARHGQILKIQPGVGRLFSMLSLQNLPRRLTFDFRDVFSSGFTFDKIGGSVKIDKGVMRSDDFRMEGPTARVDMRGETDLQKETQHLYIKVTPYLSDSLSIAALAGGPVVGAAAYVAQKLLKDPLNQLAADEYEIGGTWDNPQELKGDSRTRAPASPAASPLGK
ncbi:YhdP family protein [Methylovorus sp. SPW-M1]